VTGAIDSVDADGAAPAAAGSLDRRQVMVAVAGTVAMVGGGAAAAARLPGLADYRGRDLLGLADLIRRRDASAAEIVDLAIAAAEAANPAINAISVKLYDRARAAARQAQPGPFFGAPYAYKDLGVTIAGAPFTNGSRFFKGAVAPRNSTIVDRGDAAGLVPIALSAAPELGLTGTTESRLLGRTRNPWALDRIAGGSSGGAAALVAAGVIPAAQASDYAGSIRTPASCCGLFGLKPSRGRTPTGPARIEDWNGLHQLHAITRSVRDSAALLDMARGREPGDQYAAPPPERPYLAEIDHPTGRLRIAVQRRTTPDMALDPAVGAALDRTVALLGSLGHMVEEAAPEIDYGALGAGLTAVLGANVAFLLDQRGEALGRPVGEGDVEPITWWLYGQGREVRATDLERADHAFHAAGLAMARFHQRYDLLLSPTLAEPPLPLGTIDLDHADIAPWVRRITAFGPFTALANMTGQPAMSVPLEWNDQGLPIGMMFTARYGDEAMLFRLAAQLEKARPWFHKVPPFSPSRVGSALAPPASRTVA
jgi:amidase/6-aminohexanoate-cyclic-dimer hydrolase